MYYGNKQVRLMSTFTITAHKILHTFADSTTLHEVQRIFRAKVWY